jgi:hypothetical protein
MLPAKTIRTRIVFLGAAVVTGALLNFFKVSIFPDVNLLFGGVAYLTVALLEGPVAGGLAALLVSLPAILTLGPGSLVLFSAEGLAVGLLARRGFQASIADLIYWTAAGVPAAMLYYMLILHYPHPTCWVVVVTYPLNGFLNMLVAQIAEAVIRAHRQRTGPRESLWRPTLRANLSRNTILVATLPVMLLTVVSGPFYVQRLERDAREQMQEAALSVRQDIDAVVSSHQSTVSALASFIGETKPDRNALGALCADNLIEAIHDNHGEAA